ncbi:MAG: CopG family transcriptional regulator [Candidatus Omnitrophica bacterium]|nr:CopG family transcriptional regulator [Candidatus Omnitrophota bacterium]
MEKSENKDYVNVPLPAVIVDKVKTHIKGTEFNSVAEYIIFILKEVLTDKDESGQLTAEEEKQVKETLKKLGYLKDE